MGERALGLSDPPAVSSPEDKMTRGVSWTIPDPDPRNPKVAGRKISHMVSSVLLMSVVKQGPLRKAEEGMDELVW